MDDDNEVTEDSASPARFAAVSPELHFLLSCVNPGGTERSAPVTVAPGLDWDTFLELVARHRLAPAVHASLGQIAKVPLPVRTAIKNACESNRILILQRLREIRELHEAFARRGVECAVLKGVLAGLEIYGDPSRRHAGDIDLLIRPRDFRKADAALVELGFRPRTLSFPIKDSLLPWVLRQACDKEYIHPQSRTPVELHWRLIRNPHLLPLEPDEIFAQARLFKIAGTSLRILDPGHQLLFLCAHGAKHGWFRLFWLVDVAPLLASASVPGSANLFHAHGLDRILHQAVLLAQELLGMQFSPDLTRVAEQDQAARLLSRWALAEILGAERDLGVATLAERVRRHRYALALRRGFSYRAAHFRQAILAQEDWEEISIPAGWEWLYYGLRPVLWLRRRLRQV